MVLTRLLYFSENQMDAGGGSRLAGLRDILAASQRNNKAAGITGALVFDDRWFIQALEGDRANVWATLRRIEEDERHADFVVIDARQVEGRLFANLWMGLATRGGETASAFAPYLKNGLLRPQDMAAADVLDLMSALCKQGSRGRSPRRRDRHCANSSGFEQGPLSRNSSAMLMRLSLL